MVAARQFLALVITSTSVRSLANPCQQPDARLRQRLLARGEVVTQLHSTIVALCHAQVLGHPEGAGIIDGGATTLRVYRGSAINYKVLTLMELLLFSAPFELRGEFVADPQNLVQFLDSLHREQVTRGHLHEKSHNS